CSRGEYW
nr:immunoglobulin heavy chain junction region [Macaca mulatta]MOV49384.1 immunoglobulin heavy chain junction region [Macaca mulatta]